ncbi:MAG TPA: hypothetical protein VKB75_03125, partial [Jatrophihabitans sp.]|nr:hypothetical protein [Jatrophihabitans sp.]
DRPVLPARSGAPRLGRDAAARRRDAAVNRRALLVLPLAAGLVACSSSGKGGSASDVPTGMPTTATGLATLLQSAVHNITSAHLHLDIEIAGMTLTGAGDEKLSDGKLVALDLTENLPNDAGAIRVISVGGKTYAQLPASISNSGSRYLLVTPNSTNSVIQQLAGALDSALTSASLGGVAVFVRAAKSVKGEGTAPVGGVNAVHYSIMVDIAKLPASLPGRDQLQSGGVATLPVELYVDRQGRPVKISEQLRVGGQGVSTTALVTDYNKPVTITAPPANQVGS